MRITDLLDEKSIELNASPQTKKEALDMAVELMNRSGKISDIEAYRKQVYAREEESTTGIGEGIAIPHGKCSAVKRPGLAAMVIKDGVEFDSLDGEPVKLIFLIAAPDTEDNVHVDVLSKLSMLMMDESFVDSLEKAKSVKEFISVIDEKDADSGSVDDRLSDNDNAAILAVTSCPTGIAHTFMAAEGLEKAAKKAGISIKIETRGSGGTKNTLTNEEIAKAACIIVAADAQVPMARFDGKPVIECPVSDGISKADELIERAVAGDAPLYHASEITEKGKKTQNGGSAGHRIYTYLMNGVSHMLPFVVGGGILIAIAFLIDGLTVDINSLTEAERGNFGTINEAASVFKEIGGYAFGLMLPVLAGFIAMAIGDRPALALGFVGGVMAANGKSGFLGAILIGFLAGYVIVVLRKICEHLPKALEKVAPVLIYPLVGIFIVGISMKYAVDPVMGGLNELLNNGLENMSGTNKVLLGFVLGGMMAVDMGGPFNKASYVFGVGAIAAGNYDVMAAVMIGGMVPPCAIALATLIFKNKFTKAEREAGPTNFIMGLAFITEGAIPYAAADPIHVIPSCVIGSGVAGALSMLFKCTLMAPHGGIFVFPVVGNGVYYMLTLVAGTIISSLLLGLFKKKVTE